MSATEPPLPRALHEGVRTALRDAGRGDVRHVVPVGGGSIHRAARIRTDGGADAFLKWSDDSPPGMFTREAEGLRALREAGGVRVPAVLGLRDAGDGADGGEHAGAGAPGWLLLEWVERGVGGRAYAEGLGRGVAALHDADPPGTGGTGAWGWPEDNWIGSLPQPNTARVSWGRFWGDNRLEPQLRRAVDGGWLDGAGRGLLEDVLGRAPNALDEGAPRPSLLHGDLWSGNVWADPADTPVLVDPAVYVGHGEVDLAMSELFGGFPAGWLGAYAEVRPIPESYPAFRRPLYQLYYLLVHVNLFGSSYVGRTLAAARAAREGM